MVDILFFITDVKLLSENFYSLFPRMLQMYVHVEGFTYAKKARLLNALWYVYATVYAKVSNTVKPVLMTTFLKQPPILNNHFVVLP